MEIKKDLVASVQARIGRTKYQTAISSGQYSIIVDEPEIAGGTDTGPQPIALLLGSLGSCTAITLRMYLDRKMWPVDEININVELFKGDAGVSITCGLSFKGELAEEQKNRLVQIANACPIHKILTGNIIIETGLA